MKLIKYWLKLIKLENNNLCKAAYNLLYEQDVNGRKNWATKIKHVLYAHGFGYVWICQQVGNDNLFMFEFNRRLCDIGIQKWSDQLHQNKKLECYRTYKSVLNPEKYLYCINSFKLRQAIARFRCSNHQLEIETGRHKGIDRELRHCSFCKNQKIVNCIEDEHHFICHCPLYICLRK